MHGESEQAVSGLRSGSGSSSAPSEEIVSVPLEPRHKVAAFKSSKQFISDFLVQRAAQWQERRICRVFVFENPDDRDEIWGYYTLSASALAVPQLSGEDRESLPKSAGGVRIPMVQLGYMGRHDDPALAGIGAGFIYDAALRVALGREQFDAWGILLMPHPDSGKRLQDWYADECGFQFVSRDPKRPDTAVLMYQKLEPLLDLKER